MSNVTKQNREISSLQPTAQVACGLFLEECKKKGINIFVTEYHRSKDRQDYLYCKGRTVQQCVAAGISKPFAEKYSSPKEKQVTWTRNSNHSTGYAWDIACSPPKDLYDSKIIAYAGEVAKKLGIEWGGSWKEQDTPHFQVSKNWKAPVMVPIDVELEKAVNKIIASGININAATWNKVENINLRNVPALINKLGGLDKLVKDKIISSKELWESGEYNENHVIVLIKKVAVTL